MERAAQAQLHEARSWHTLLHYEPRWLGGVISTVDAPTFFNAPDGGTNPQAELAATLRAFFAPPVVETEKVQHPQCRFPARWSWLVEALDIDERLPRQRCARFEWWRGRLAADSVSVVFASAYLNNPASMFGHTFLRLNRAARGAGADLVTYSVNFAADPTTANPLFYAILGLTGGFAGSFSTTPYYLKVKEYSDVEHRTLWEYDLDITRTELDRLVEHLWEMGQAYFNYFYLDENCSYHLLSLLEVARPQLHLLTAFPTWTIPTDTLRVILEQPGLVTARRFRPSAYQLMLAHRGGLTGDEVELAADVAAGARAPDDLAGRAPARQAAVLDAAASLLAFRAGQTPTAGQRKTRRALLLRRGRLGVPATRVEVPEDPAPETGHETALWAFGGGRDTVSGFVNVDVRMSLHDLLGPTAGYVPGSQIEFVRIGLRVPTTPTFDPSVDHVRLLRITSLAPYDPWSVRPSWRLSTGVERRRQDACSGSGCLFYELTGGPGFSGTLGPALLYVFADAGVAAGPAFRDDYRIAVGASTGVLVTILPAWRVQAEATYRYPVFGEPRPRFLPGDSGAPFVLQATTAIDLAKDIELRLSVHRQRGYESVEGSVRLYY